MKGRAVKALFKTESAHQTIFVGEQRGVRFLSFGDRRAGWQGAYLPARPERLYFPYQQAFSLHTAWRPRVERFLAIGVGTGTAIGHVFRRHPEARIVGVDIDLAVIEAARRFFALPESGRIELLAADARSAVPQMAERFDLIFLDVFYREETPKTLLSPLYLNVLRDRLAPGGVLAINAILATAGPRGQRFRDLCRHLKLTVGPVWWINVGLVPQWENNVLLFARRMPTGVPATEELRARARREIRVHPRAYAPYSRLIPVRIRRG